MSRPSTSLGAPALLAVGTVLLRLPYIDRPLTPDEGGFLLVASQWHPGTSLYGDYWVDRPPLLIGLFWIADRLGGVLALRVIGGLVAAVAVFAVGMAVRRLVGAGPSAAASAVTAALLVSPLAGAAPVNGELLAAAFVATGTWLVVVALDRGSVMPTLAAGAAAASAVLVKQNMVDVVVFAVAALLVLSIRRGLAASRPFRFLGLFGAGFVGACLLGLAGAWVLGSRPDDVLYAMYGFRLQASELITQESPVRRELRLRHLAVTEVTTLAPLLVLGAAVAVLRYRRRLTPLQLSATLATLLLVGWAVVSVLAGGSYWLHYLVQLAVPTGLIAGWLAHLVSRRTLFLLLTPFLLVATASWIFGMTETPMQDGEIVGTAIGRVAAPGDTMVSLLGDADTVRAAGLQSPYPYAWSLPARTLDPHFLQLHRVLTGPRAPTWLVLRPPGGPHAARKNGSLAHYRLVETVCKRSIYLRAGVVRQMPVPRDDTCGPPPLNWLTELLTDLEE